MFPLCVCVWLQTVSFCLTVLPPICVLKLINSLFFDLTHIYSQSHHNLLSNQHFKSNHTFLGLETHSWNRNMRIQPAVVLWLRTTMNKLCTPLLWVCVLASGSQQLAQWLVVRPQEPLTGWTGRGWDDAFQYQPTRSAFYWGREGKMGERERETQFREGLFVRFQEQSSLEAIAGQPGPQREKRRAFNMGTGTADISTLWRRTEREGEREERRGEECNRCKKETVNSEEDLKACLFKRLVPINPLKPVRGQQHQWNCVLMSHPPTKLPPPQVMLACRWYTSLSFKPFFRF